jgi:hypothetical protein
MVAAAYAGDLARAMADTDEQVAATVAAWETSQGMPARDWYAIGAEEQADDGPRLPLHIRARQWLAVHVLVRLCYRRLA